MAAAPSTADEGIARRVRIHVERVHVEVREKVVERGRQWIDDDIEVLSRPRLAVDRARKRANDHVRDLGGFEELLAHRRRQGFGADQSFEQSGVVIGGQCPEGDFAGLVGQLPEGQLPDPP